MKQLYLFVFYLFILIPAYTQEKSMVLGNTKREFIVKVPSSYTGNSNVQLVIVLHDYNTNIKDIGSYTGFDKLAEKNGFIVVYPFGKKCENGYYIWNSGGIYSQWTDNSNDIEFIDSLISYMIDSYAIDEKCVYLAGHSNGAMMSYKLACHLSDRISAIACVSGQMIDFNKSPEFPVPIMHIHGDADLIVPHTGTTDFGFQIPSVDQVIKKWLEWNNCSTIPVILKYDPLLTALKWQGDAEVRLYLLHGQGHDWPTIERGGWPASEHIWNFFKENKKNN